MQGMSCCYIKRKHILFWTTPCQNRSQGLKGSSHLEIKIRKILCHWAIWTGLDRSGGGDAGRERYEVGGGGDG